MKLEHFYDESNVKKKTRYKIVNQAIGLLVENEFDKVTMVDVANACDITQRNLYRYYKNKDYLIMDAIYYCVHKYTIYSSPVSVVMQAKTGIEVLRDVMDALAFRHDPDPEIIRAIKLMVKFDYYLNTLERDNPAYERYINEYVADFNIDIRNDLCTALSRGLQDGTIRALTEDVSAIAEYIFQSTSALLTRVLIKQTERKIFSFELVDRHMDMIIAGLKAR